MEQTADYNLGKQDDDSIVYCIFADPNAPVKPFKAPVEVTVANCDDGEPNGDQGFADPNCCNGIIEGMRTTIGDLRVAKGEVPAFIIFPELSKKHQC